MFFWNAEFIFVPEIQNIELPPPYHTHTLNPLKAQEPKLKVDELTVM